MRTSSAATAAGRCTRSSGSGDSIGTYRLVERQNGALEPARVTGRSFEDFDDGRLQADATEQVAGERCRTRLYLEGVHCAACVWLVEKLPSALRGVDEIRLNLTSAVAEITWSPNQTRLSTVARALDRLGYTPHLHRASGAQEARRVEDRASLARLGVATACAMNLMFLHGALYAGEYSGMATPYETLFRWFSLVVAVPVLLYSARPFFQTALAGLRARVVHIDLPVAIAFAVTFAASAWNVVRGSGPIWFDSLAMLVAALLGARQVQRSAQRAALERADSLRGAAFLEFARKITGAGPDAPVDRGSAGRAHAWRPRRGAIGRTRPRRWRRPLGPLVARQRRADRRGGRDARAGGRRGARRRHEPRGAARRARRRGRLADARRGAAGHRPGGALQEARHPADDGSRGPPLRPGAARARRHYRRRVAPPRPGRGARARRRPARRRLSLRARPLGAARRLHRAVARGARGRLHQEPRRAGAAPHGLDRAARQDRDAHRGTVDGHSLAGR